MTIPTEDQRALVLESVAAGCDLARACKAAKTTPEAVRALTATDDDFAEQLEAAQAEGGATQAVASTWEDVARTSTASREASRVVSAQAATPPTARHLDESGTLDLAQIERQASTFAPGPFGYVLWLDDRLSANGFPAMSPWWRETLRAFYASGKRWLVVSVGRGGGKSSTLVLVAVSDALFTPRSVPPGQRWIWPFISITPSDSGNRIGNIVATLKTLNIEPTRVRHDSPKTIELLDARGNEIAFVALASSIANASGPSTIGVTIDEEAKLKGNANSVGNPYANPSGQILLSLTQTFRSREGIRGIRCSSAWTPHGSHPESVAEGDNSQNHVARIGHGFLEAARAGLMAVAHAEAKIDMKGAELIHAHAKTLTAHSTCVPTWVANGGFISAQASRDEIDAVAVTSLEGLTRAQYWLRECCSVPMVSGKRAAAAIDQTVGLASFNRRLWEIGRTQSRDGAPGNLIRMPNAPAGDPRNPYGETGGGRSM